MTRIRDPRLHESPKLWRKQNAVLLSFKVNTPLRISFVHYNVMQPAVLIWKGLLVILVVDLLLWCLGVWSLFFHLQMSREMAYLAMVLAPLPWYTERMSRYSLTRILLGKRMRIKITRQRIWIGRWPFRKEYDRSYGVTFGLKRFESSREPAYKNSCGLYLVLDDISRIKLTEIFDPLAASRIVGSCNMALTLTDEMETYEMDPTAEVA